MGTIAIVLELDDTAPMKTFTALKALPGVTDIHMDSMRSPAELRRFLRGELSAAPASGASKPPAPGGETHREALARYLAAHGPKTMGDIAAALNDRPPQSLSSMMNVMKNAGEVKRTANGQWSITAAGRRKAGEPTKAQRANGADEDMTDEQVVELIAQLGGKTERVSIEAIKAAFVARGFSLRNAAQRVRGLKLRGLASVRGDGADRTVQLKEQSGNAT